MCQDASPDSTSGLGKNIWESLRPRHPPSMASATETTGLKCAPEMGPKVSIKATSAAPVAIAFARRAIAVFPAESRSAMIPEPTTAATRNAVPRNSAQPGLVD